MFLQIPLMLISPISTLQMQYTLVYEPYWKFISFPLMTFLWTRVLGRLPRCPEHCSAPSLQLGTILQFLPSQPGQFEYWSVVEWPSVWATLTSSAYMGFEFLLRIHLNWWGLVQHFRRFVISAVPVSDGITLIPWLKWCLSVSFYWRGFTY